MTKEEAYDAFLELSQDFGAQAMAEEDSGIGIKTKRRKEEFLEYFGGLLINIVEKYEIIKNST